MKKDHLLKTLSLGMITAWVLGGCGSGNSSPVPSNYTKPQGPVSYVGINTMFNPDALNQNNTQTKSLNSTSNGCGNAYGTASQVFTFAAQFLTLIPEAGHALSSVSTNLGQITGIIGTAKGSNCMAQNLANINASLAYQQKEITSVYQNELIINNDFWDQSTANAQETAKTAVTSNNNANKSISLGVSSVMKGVGLWNADASYVANSYTESELQANINNYIESNSGVGGLNEYFNLSLIGDVENISGANFSKPSTDTIGTAAESIFVTVNTTSTYYDVLSSRNALLASQLAGLIANNSESNLVPYISVYNSAIVNTYTQSLVNINSAYQLQYLANYLNFVTYQKFESNYKSASYITIGPLNADGVFYKPSEILLNNFPGLTESAAQLAYYNNTQKVLTDVMAQAVNNAYSIALGFLVTDAPVGAQSYPTMSLVDTFTGKHTGENIDYASLVGKYVYDSNTYVPSGATNVIYNAYSSGGDMAGESLVASLIAASKIESTLYYQFQGLKNVAAMEKALASYNATYGLNGSESGFMNSLKQGGESVDVNIFTGYESDIYFGAANSSTIVPLYVNESGYPKLFGTVTNNIAACSANPNTALPAYNLYNYTPTNSYTNTIGRVGVPYLMCGNWSIDNIQNQVTSYIESVSRAYMGLAVQYNDMTGTSIFTYNNPTNTISNTTPACKTHCGTVTENVFHNSQGNFPTTGLPITALSPAPGSASSNWGGNTSNQNNNIIQGNSYESILAGWMTTNYPSGLQEYDSVTNVMAIQISFPDGFIAPLTINNTNIKGSQGNYVSIGINPNTINVLIDGQPMVDTTGVILNANSWGPAPNQLYQTSYSGGSPFNMSAFKVNNNLLMLNGTVTSSNGSTDVNLGNVHVASIVLNPSSCPGIGDLLAVPSTAAGAGVHPDQQVWNYVCGNIPVYSISN
jgi:hypothetical protein